jgi:hypothetical protein
MRQNFKEWNMKKELIAVATAVTIGVMAVAMPTKVEARSGWWIPGAIIGGLALGAIVSSAYGPYYYGPGPYYYYYGPGPYYYSPRYYYRPYRYYPRTYRYRHRRHYHYYR